MLLFRSWFYTVVENNSYRQPYVLPQLFFLLQLFDISSSYLIQLSANLLSKVAAVNTPLCVWNKVMIKNKMFTQPKLLEGKAKEDPVQCLWTCRRFHYGGINEVNNCMCCGTQVGFTLITDHTSGSASSSSTQETPSKLGSHIRMYISVAFTQVMRKNDGMQTKSKSCIPQLMNNNVSS